MTLNWVLSTSTGPETLDEIAGALGRFWYVHSQVPNQIRLHMGIAVGEVGANIIAHADKGRPVRLHMELRCCLDCVQVQFTDDGHPVDVDLDSVEMPDASADSGRGLALAKAVLRYFDYRRNNANLWTLVSQPFDWAVPG